MSEPVVALIVAMASNRVIGNNNQLPWHLPEDLKHFKRITMGKPIVMGRKTYDSIGRPLPGRLNIVISRNAGYRPEGVEVCPDIESALQRALAATRDNNGEELMVIGGAQIYQKALPLAGRLYLTEVHGEFAGDTFFPELSKSEWQEVERCDKTAENGLGYSFVVMERID